MAHSILCPYCFKSFPANTAKYQCENQEKFNGNEKCPSLIDAILNDYWQEDGVPSKRIFDARVFKLFSHKVRGAECPTCHMRTTRLVCPECHNPIPTQMIEEGSEIISITGDRNSGKTVYFLSLIQQLKRYGYKIGLYEVNPMDLAHSEATKPATVYTKMAAQLFDNHHLPEQNRATRPAPLIFRLSFQGKTKKENKSIYLIFYDTAGEIFQDSIRANEMATYLKDSVGVIFLIDPFTLEGVRDILVSGGIVKNVAENYVGADPSRIFDCLLKINGNERLKDKPLALTYSKIDVVVNALEASPQGYSIQGVNLKANSSFIKTGKFNLGEIEDIHEGLKTISEEKWDTGRFWGSASGAYAEGNVRMFAISALGSNPDAAGRIDKVVPYRVMDPLVWILHKIGFAIPTVE